MKWPGRHWESEVLHLIQVAQEANTNNAAPTKPISQVWISVSRAWVTAELCAEAFSEEIGV